MERGEVARMFNVAEADVADFGVLVLLKPDGVQRVATADGVFGVSDHVSNRQLRRWPAGDTVSGIEPVEDEPTRPDAPAAEAEPATPAPDEAAHVDEVPDGTAAVVLSWVGSDQARAERAAAAEKDRDQPRSTLLAQLEKVAAQ